MALNDLGDLGRTESDPVTYTWSFIDNLSGLVVWVAVLIVFILFRENWTPKAFLILLPMFVVSVVWLGLKKATGMPSNAAMMYDIIFNSLVAGIAALWLLAERIGNRNRLATFLLAVVVMAIMCALGIVSLGGFKLSADMAGISVVFAVLAATALLAFAITGWMCRKSYSAVRFMLWLAVWTVAPCLLMMMIVAAVSVIGGLVMGNGLPPQALLLMALMFPLAGLILGGFIYAILFPFMILAFKSDLFRRRFYGCFRLKGMLAPAVAESQDQPGAWNIS